MIPTSVLIKLATLGLSKEQAEAIGEMLTEVETATREVSEAAIEKSREKARARLQKWRDKQDGNVSKRSETSRNASKPLTRVEDISSNLENTGQEEKKDRPQAAPTPRSELEAVLDANRAAAVVEHRQKLRKPLTAHAARLLAGKFAKAPDPNAAADAMVENGWQGFEPSWLEDRTRARPATAPPPRKPNAMDAYEQIAREKGWISDEPEILPSLDLDARCLPAERGGQAGAVVDLRPGIVRRFGSGSG